VRVGHASCVVLAVSLLTSCALENSPDQSSGPELSPEQRILEFQKALARLEQTEPKSPETLNDQLELATLLATQSGAQCGPDLTQARSQLERLTAGDIAGIALPSGQARVADLEYRIHLGSAACADESSRTPELLAAAAAAQRACELYRDAFDYRSMINMQFNVGFAHHEMQDLAGAVAALESAIALDREYGFLDDAQDNYATLVRWNAPPESQARAAALIRDFPRRSVTLKFGWHDSDAQITLDTQHLRMQADAVIEARQQSVVTEHVRAHGSAWRVTTEGDHSSYEFGAAADDDAVSQQLLMLFARDLPRRGDFEVTGTGAFDRSLYIGRLAEQLTTEVRSLESDRWGSDGSRHLAREVHSALGEALEPWVIDAKMAEAQSFETAAWIGATLEQGVWYDMQAPLFMPGTAASVIMNRVEFSYTRPIACASASPEAPGTCAEIIIQFAPADLALAAAVEHQRQVGHSPGGHQADYRGVTYLRLVTDPNTLVPYSVERRRYSYLSGNLSRPEEALELERSTEQFRYR
jgi:tetratricopeptide (TPR) repeat protein